MVNLLTITNTKLWACVCMCAFLSAVADKIDLYARFGAETDNPMKAKQYVNDRKKSCKNAQKIQIKLGAKQIKNDDRTMCTFREDTQTLKQIRT